MTDPQQLAGVLCINGAVRVILNGDTVELVVDGYKTGRIFVTMGNTGARALSDGLAIGATALEVRGWK